MSNLSPFDLWNRFNDLSYLKITKNRLYLFFFFFILTTNSAFSFTWDYSEKYSVDKGCNFTFNNSLNTSFEKESQETELILCNPTVSAFAIQASCTDGIPNSDGYLQISAADVGTHYNYSVGSTYTGSTVYMDGTVFNPSTDLPLKFGSFSNPTGSQDYTIRIFNGSDVCFKDTTVTMNEQDCIVGCSCTEYVYLNDTGGKKVHKFIVNSDSTLTEVLNNGNSWYPGLNTTEMNSPHGIAMDINGFLYIAEKKTGDIRKLYCNGDIFPTTEFELIGFGGTNFGAIDNVLFINDTDDLFELEAIDLCTGNLIGSICFNSSSTALTKHWGFYLDPRTNDIYYTLFESNLGGVIFKATIDDLNSGSCVTPYLLRGSTEPVIGDNFLSNTVSPFGMTTDMDGNIYIVMKKKFASQETQIYKYSPTGVLLARSILDSDAEDGTVGRFSRALGIVYAESEGVLYVSVDTDDEDEDCIAIFETTSSATDTILNYIGTGFPNPQGGSGIAQEAKGIGINEECCPINNNQVLDTILCAAVNDTIFLQELINCDGVICEGLWQEDSSNSGFTYNDCNNSITLNALNACGSFTLESDGTGNNPQCGAFKITVNITVISLDLTVTQIGCTDNGGGTFTANYDAVVDWSNVPCIAGETIIVTNNENTIGTIDPSIDSSPSTFTVGIGAYGTGTQTFKAAFSSDVCPADSLSFKTPLPCPTDVSSCSSATGCIGGNSFEDLNCNGEEETTEPGVLGIQINVYDCDNNLMNTVYSDSDGDWQVCDLTDNDQYRVEFILPESIACYASPSHVGTNNESNVQFATAPVCLDFSIVPLSGGCTPESADVIIGCYSKGNPNDPGVTNDLAIFMDPYGKNDVTNDPAITGEAVIGVSTISHKKALATIGQVGSIFGMAVDNSNNYLYTSSYLKRGTGFGPGADNMVDGSTGAIYKINLRSGQITTLVDLDPSSTSNPDPAKYSTGTNPHPNTTTDWTCDWDSHSMVGKLSWGDIDISTDNSTMYAVNMYDRGLYEIEIATGNILGVYPVPGAITNVSSAGVISPWPTSMTTCNDNPDLDVRPMATKYYNGKVYVGMVCSAESSGQNSRTWHYVFEFDPTTSSWNTSPVMDSDFSRSNFNAWPNASDYANAATLVNDGDPNTNPNGNDFKANFAILSDIEFHNGDMLLGVRNNSGDRNAPFLFNYDDCNGSFFPNAYFGSLTRACTNALGGWDHETSGACGVGAAYVENGTFYYNQGFGTHKWNQGGALAQIPGQDEVVTIAWPGGQEAHVTTWNHTTYDWSWTHQVYKAVGTTNTFGKSQGLADLELFCSIPLEIGNYVWCDSIENGIQDACERGINDMLVQLYNASGILIGQDTTVNGNYYFNQNNVDTSGVTLDESGVASPNTGWSGMDYNTSYYLVFGNSQYDNTTGRINIESDIYTGLTLVDVNSNGSDNIDSDIDGSMLSTAIGSIPANLPFISMTTGEAGCGDHRFDVGLTCESIYDWGDLPDTSSGTASLDYQTDSINNGPSHAIIGGLHLGNGVDDENDGQQSADALGDGTDEDGIVFPATMQIVPGGTMNIPFAATNTTDSTAHVEMWIDWNGDGDFADTGEMVINIDDSTAFPNYLSVGVPLDALQGQDIGVRIRLSITDDMTPYGAIDSGEVEDYLIEVNCNPKVCLPTAMERN